MSSSKTGVRISAAAWKDLRKFWNQTLLYEAEEWVPKAFYCPCWNNFRWGQLPQPVPPLNFLLLMQIFIQEKPRHCHSGHISVIYISAKTYSNCFLCSCGILCVSVLWFRLCGEVYSCLLLVGYSSDCSILQWLSGLDSLRMPHFTLQLLVMPKTWAFLSPY